MQNVVYYISEAILKRHCSYETEAQTHQYSAHLPREELHFFQCSVRARVADLPLSGHRVGKRRRRNRASFLRFGRRSFQPTFLLRPLYPLKIDFPQTRSAKYSPGLRELTLIYESSWGDCRRYPRFIRGIFDYHGNFRRNSKSTGKKLSSTLAPVELPLFSRANLIIRRRN